MADDIIKLRRSLTPGTEPAEGSLAEGELAINIPDKKMWIGGQDQNPVELPVSNIGAMGFMEFSYIMQLPVDATPSSRRISRNNDDPSQTTVLYVNRIDRYNEDISLFLQEVKAGDWFNIHLKDDTNVYEAYDVIGDPVLNGDIWEIPVSYYGHEGTIHSGKQIRLFWRVDGVITDKYREPMGSGVHHGGQISKGTGDLELNVSAGRGLIVDATTDPFKIQKKDVSWDDNVITITPSAPDIQEIHMIYVDRDGKIWATPVQNITHKLIYDYIRLGWVEISVNQIIKAIDAPQVVGQTASNLSDMFYSLRDSSKASGLRLRPCNTGLSVYCEEGTLLIPGINWYNDRKNQNILHIPQEGDVNNPIKFQGFNQFAQPLILDTVFPKYYDKDGDLTPLTGGEAVIHYVFWSAAGFSIQLGQHNYRDFATAYKNAVFDMTHFKFAPGADVAGRSILIAQVVISKHAEDFYDKSQADVISIINEESGNTINPVDLTLVPQYLLRANAAEDLTAGDELSMDVNGNLQKYPATGGEGTSEYTTDNVVIHSAVFLDSTNNQGIIGWVADGSSDIRIRTAQGNTDGSITYSPIVAITTNGTPIDFKVCRIDSTRAGFIWSDNSGTHLGMVTNNGIGSEPSISNTKTLSANGESADCVWDADNGNLIGVYAENGTSIYNQYCPVSGDTIEDSPASPIYMMDGTDVRCTTEGGNVIVVATNGGSSVWREAAWKQTAWWLTGKYDDQTGTVTVNDCDKHCGLQAQSGVILAQFEHNGMIQTYQATYKSGHSIDAPGPYDSPIEGKHGDLIKTESGIGYTAILNNDNKIEVYEGTLQGTYEYTYTSGFQVDPINEHLQALMFGSVFAFGVGFDHEDARKVYLINSAETRTDHFVAVAPYNAVQGQRVSVDIALPIIRLPREYPPGTFYYYGPYKYQVITPTQAVLIIESTIMQNAQV